MCIKLFCNGLLQWTDDTSMALCLAESLIECHAFNPIDQSKRYWRWYQVRMNPVTVCMCLHTGVRVCVHAGVGGVGRCVGGGGGGGEVH